LANDSGEDVKMKHKLKEKIGNEGTQRKVKVGSTNNKMPEGKLQ